MDTQGQGETKRFGHRADTQANGAPKVAAKVVRFALRCTVLVQGHDTRHAATICRGHGVIADEDCLPLNHHGLLLTQDKGPPTREQLGQAPRRGAKEMDSGSVSRRLTPLLWLPRWRRKQRLGAPHPSPHRIPPWL